MSLTLHRRNWVHRSVHPEGGVANVIVVALYRLNEMPLQGASDASIAGVRSVLEAHCAVDDDPAAQAVELFDVVAEVDCAQR